VVQPAEVRDGVDGAVAVFDGARLRRVAVQRLMAARAVVVRDILAEELAQVRFVQRHQVVRELAPDAPDDALGDGPRRRIERQLPHPRRRRACGLHVRLGGQSPNVRASGLANEGRMRPVLLAVVVNAWPDEQSLCIRARNQSDAYFVLAHRSASLRITAGYDGSAIETS